MHLDNIDQKLLNRMQVEVSLVSQPYLSLAEYLGIGEDEVIRRIGELRAEGIVRQIGALFDAKRIGYKTTLVAMRVTGAELEGTLELLAAYPVSHAYERDHHFNVWFTLALPAAADVDAELARMVSPVKAEACFSLPALKLFKLRTYFSSGGEDGVEASDTGNSATADVDAGLSADDRKAINEIQQDLPLSSRPFGDMAMTAGMSEEAFLSRCRALLSRGVMRRYSASVNHRQVGFVANAMCCWVVPPEKIDAAGERLASLREVSHCYERRTNPAWKHNLFAMVHGREKGECRQLVDKVSAEIDLKDGIMLFSTREFKKMRLKYAV
jgi:siroheme decarboxylase